MTDRIEISPRLEQWAQRAGYTLTPGSCTEDGRAIFSSSLGEVRLLVGRSQGDWFLITDSDRMGPEHFILSAPSIDTIERYFFGRFCMSIRSNLGMPRVRTPDLDENASAQFSIGTREFEGVERFALIASDGSTVAIGSADRVTAKAELTKLALYVTATIDEIEASAFDPDGKPLFAHR